MENETMGVNTYDVGTLAGLAGINGGYGLGGNQALYDTLLAQHTQAEVRREGDQSANRDNFQSTQQVLQGNRIESMFFQSHLDSDRKFASLSEQINASALKAMECCCDTQKLVIQEGAATRSHVDSLEIDRLRSQVACNAAALAATANRSVFVAGDATTSNNSGQIA